MGIFLAAAARATRLPNCPPKVWPEYISGFGVLMVGISNTDLITKLVETLAISQRISDLFQTAKQLHNRMMV